MGRIYWWGGFPMLDDDLWEIQMRGLRRVNLDEDD
jgi:hypothetical protein